MSRERSTSPVRPKSQGPSENVSPSPTRLDTTPSRRFPRTISAQISGSTSLDSRITDHIASSTSQVSHLAPKPVITGPKPESGILPSLAPNETALSKVYGSVLQPKESLVTHSCASCATPFLPDATIYPDPSLPDSDEPRFLCRQCFIINGGSKGLCPNCNKPVTILKAEGGFVYAADKYWHKKCFNCEGCLKNIGNSPMVDLLGRPSCPECFDTCLSREPRTPKQTIENARKMNNSSERCNLKGWDSSTNTPNKFQDSSPAIEELEQRLGIGKRRESSPAIEELSQRLSSIGRNHQPRYSNPSSPLQSRYGRAEGSPSPTRRLERLRSSEPNGSPGGSSSVFGNHRRFSGSPAPTIEAIDEMKKRFFRHKTVSPVLSTVALSESSLALSSPLPPSNTVTSSFSSKMPVSRTQSASASASASSSSPSSTPDFMSDISDTLTQSSLSGIDSPLNINESLPSHSSCHELLMSPEDVIFDEEANILNQSPQSTVKLRSRTSETEKKLPSETSGKIFGYVSTSSTCAKCHKQLFTLREGGKFVTVPGENGSDASQTFHRDCFRCTFCDGVFSESTTGQAIFVKSHAGPAHVEVRHCFSRLSC